MIKILLIPVIFVTLLISGCGSDNKQTLPEQTTTTYTSSITTQKPHIKTPRPRITNYTHLRYVRAVRNSGYADGTDQEIIDEGLSICNDLRVGQLPNDIYEDRRAEGYGKATVISYMTNAAQILCPAYEEEVAEWLEN